MDDFDINLELAKRVLEQLNNPQRVRNAFHRHGRSYRGRFYSHKGPDGWIPYESAIARDLLRVYEHDYTVIAVWDEPFIMQYRLDGKFHEYTPDYLIRRADGACEVAEVKEEKEASTPENQRRFKAIGIILQLAKAPFVIYTKQMLQTPILQHNLSLLERHRHLIIHPVIAAQLQGHLRRHDHMPLGELADRIGCRRTVLVALARGLIMADIHGTRIDDNSLIRRV